MDEKFLTSDERGIYRDWERLFESAGWLLLQREMETELKNIPTLAFVGAKSFEELTAMRVRAKVISELLSYPAIIEQRKQHQIQEREIQIEDDKYIAATELM